MQKYIPLFCCFICQFTFAQQFVNPKKYKAGVHAGIEINLKSDVDYINTHIPKFYQLEKIRINTLLDLSAITPVISLLDNINVVELIKFSGDIQVTDIDNLDWVNEVVIRVRDKEEASIVFTENIGKLQKLILIFDESPTNWEFLQNWRCKSLQIIGPTTSQQIEIMLNSIAKMPKLKHLGIGLDRLTFLPKKINALTKLTHLTLIDNLSWVTEPYFTEIPEQSFYLEKTINEGLNASYFKITNVASDPIWNDFERSFLLNIWDSTKIISYISEVGDSSSYSSFATFIPFNVNNKTNIKSTFGFDPLIKNKDESSFTFNGNNQQDRVYYINRNTAIFIAKNSLIGINKQVYNGEYDLRVNLSKTISQHFALGNTLRFDSLGEQYALSPNAVIEVLAQADKEILSIKDGYTIKVAMLVEKDTANRFYAYNTKKSNWVNWWDYDYEFSDEKLVKLDFTKFYSKESSAVSINSLNKLNANEHFETFGYNYHLPPGINKLKLIKNKGLFLPLQNGKTELIARRGKKNVTIVKLPNSNKSNEIIIQVKDKSGFLFPELKPISKIPFYLSSSVSKKLFLSTFITNQIYNDVRIQKQGNDYFLDLKKDNGYWHIALLKPSLTENDKTISDKKYAKRMLKYSALHTKRLTAWQNTNIQNELLETKETVKTMFTNTKAANLVEFKVRSFGAFAWANPIAIIKDTFLMQIIPCNAGAIPLKCKRFIVAQKTPFTQFTHTGLDIYNVTIPIHNVLYVACEAENGLVYFLNAKQIKNKQLLNNTIVQLPMNELPQPINSLNELTKLLQLKND